MRRGSPWRDKAQESKGTRGRANTPRVGRGSAGGIEALEANARASGFAARRRVRGRPWSAAWRRREAVPGRGSGRNVTRAAGVERRNGSPVGSKALKSEPQGRYRDEISPDGARRRKPSGGCETLKTERSRVRQARRDARSRGRGVADSASSKRRRGGKLRKAPCSSSAACESYAALRGGQLVVKP